MTAFFIQFRRITDYRNIRFYIIFIIFIQKHSKWSRINLTLSTFTINIVAYYLM